MLEKPFTQQPQEPRVDNAPSTSVNPKHPEILRTTRRTHQRITCANKPYQHFLEDQSQKWQRIKAKQQTTAADKISHKTLNKLLREQATADAKKHKQLKINDPYVPRVCDAPEW